jgi:hypothetical protein
MNATAKTAKKATATAEPEAKKTVMPAGKKAEPFQPLGERDPWGFGCETETSWLLAQLEKGGVTKTELQQKFLKKFVTGDTENARKAEEKRKETSFSVFFSDVKQHFGKYHASRSLIIEQDEDGKLSLEPKRAALVKDAIKKGVLNELRGHTMAKHGDKIRVILKKYNLPLPEPKKESAA